MSVLARSGTPIVRLRERIFETVFASPVYRYTLIGRVPKQLRFTPSPLWHGDTSKGAGILAGRFDLGGEAEIVSIDPWSVEDTAPTVAAALHGFSWLRDAAAADDQDLARERVRTIVQDWIAHNSNWTALSWRADVVGERIANWLAHYDNFFARGSRGFRSLFMRQLSQQLTHLARIASVEVDGSRRFIALKGLIVGTASLVNNEKHLRAALRKLKLEIDRQILPDGGHCERSPAAQHIVLRQLIEIRASLAKSQNEVPEFLQSAIDRMAPLLRFFRHQDGGLGLFNGSREEDATEIDSTLIIADARGRPPRRAPNSGYERLLSGRLLLIADTGPPPLPGFDLSAHAGTLSCEISVGRERLLVNCGAAEPDDPVWQTAQRTTAAHSTLSIGDRNSSELLDRGGVGRRPELVTSERLDNDDFLEFHASHDGYLTNQGLVHRRQIKISKQSERIEGLDCIEGNETHGFTVRFHLHPDVTVSLGQGGETALMKLTKGGGWRFSAEGHNLRLEESVYLGESRPRRTQQLLIEGECVSEKTEISWMIEAVGS